MKAPRVLLYLILAGLLARVIYLNQVAGLPFFQEPVGDSARYLERAREILQGDLVGSRPFFYGGILYPYLLALDLALFGSNLYPICLAQALAGCGLAWLLYSFARAAARPGEERVGRAVGVLAAGMTLFYGPIAFLEADILMISWALLLIMGGALLALTAAREPGGEVMRIRLAAAGLCLGLAASERPNLIALLPALAVWILVFFPRGYRIRATAAMMVGGAVVLLSVAALNHAASGRWITLTTSGGINFYIGNHEGARGTFEEPWSEADSHFAARYTDLEQSSLMMARRMAGRDLDAVEASHFWFVRGLEFLRQKPAEAAWLYLRKVMLFWNAAEVPNHLNFTFLRSVAPALWLMPLGFGLVAPLGLYGLFASRSREIMTHQAMALLCLLVALPAVTTLPFFVADRYRISAVPPLAVAAACGLCSLGRMLASRLTRRRGCLHVACVWLLALAMAQPLTEFDASRDHWLMAQAHKKQGNLSVAARHYLRALEISPDDAALHNNLGVVFGQMGELDRAEAEYRQAIRTEPSLAFPHKNLGLALMRHGATRADEAFEHLTIAERAEPDDVDVARALAALFLSRGDPEAARRRALKVLVSAPEDRTARAVLQATGPSQGP